MSDALTTAIERLKRGGLQVPPAAEASLRRQLAEHGGALSEKTVEEFLQKFKDGIKSIITPVQVLRPGETQTVTEGSTLPGLTGDLTKFLSGFEDGGAISQMLNLNFKIDVAQKVMRGGGHFLTDQTDVDEYPAWELHRIYERDLPRGEKRGPKGTIIEVPEDAWDTEDGRWVKACREAGDDDALRVFQQTGRMVALKASGVWQALGDGAGGYDDTLGNPFAPFAFNSGYGTDGVPTQECVELGLMDAGEKAERNDFDFSKLFAQA